MLFSFYCLDKAGAGETRLANRAAHLAFAETLGGRLVFGGPLLSGDGSAMVGSLLVIECADRAEAEALAAADPYARAGLFESVTIRPVRQVFPRS
jgi:uncharacterized protein YciI